MANAIDATVVNLSEGGMALTALKDAFDLRPGSLVEVEFRLPRQPTTTHVRGPIAWVAPSARSVEFGLHFADLDNPAHRIIKQFVESFRSRIVSVGFDFPLEWSSELADRYDAETLDFETLKTAQSDGLLGLVVTGSEEAQVERVLESTEALSLPVMSLVEGPIGPKLLALSRKNPRLAIHRLPTDIGLLLNDLDRCLQTRTLAIENEILHFELQNAWAPAPEAPPHFSSRIRFPGIIGQSPAMERVYEHIERVSRVNTSVVLTGETGTGKGLFAKLIHERSPRSRRPFVSQNCAALTDTLLDSELFGHVRGAFTGAVADRAGLFEAANGGSIFLDEVAEMSAGMQAKLLQVLQDGEVRRVGATATLRVDVRVICATHADLRRLVKERRFREDLYYRLMSFVIALPPLRERSVDVVPLARHFLLQFQHRNRLAQAKLTPAAERALEQAQWPGNVRHLQHTVERLALMSDGHIDAALVRRTLEEEADPPVNAGLTDDLQSRERALIENALEAASGVIADAARSLGLERSTLSRKIKRLGLKPRSGTP